VCKVNILSHEAPIFVLASLFVVVLRGVDVTPSMEQTPSPYLLTAVGKSHVGRVRKTNQDSFFADPETGLLIVADGMGGHAGGEIASQLCIQQICKFLDQERPQIQALGVTHPDARLSSILADAINHASTRIYERALEEPHLRGMGTTATLLKIMNGHGYCAHVGDSRLYLVRNQFIYQISNDHSLVSEQVRAGLLTREEAELHHLRNVITRSVGYQEEEDVDKFPFALEDGDYFLLCSDGLHGKVQDIEISKMVQAHGLAAAQLLIDLANERGGEDNITVVIGTIKVPGESVR
jgi:PPM family protein phosphatase